MSQRVFSVSSNAIFKKIVKLVSVKILFTNYTSWKTVIFDQFYEDWAILIIPSEIKPPLSSLWHFYVKNVEVFFIKSNSLEHEVHGEKKIIQGHHAMTWLRADA